MIAMALACDPELIIADEPTTALDVTVQAQILELLRDLTRESNAALMLITHDLGVVARYSDRVAVMYGGRIIEAAPADELYSNPRHPVHHWADELDSPPGRRPKRTVDPDRRPATRSRQHAFRLRFRTALHSSLTNNAKEHLRHSSRFPAPGNQEPSHYRACYGFDEPSARGESE